MKRIIGGLLCTAMIYSLLVSTKATSISASSYVLMDAASGRVLCEHNAHQQRPIASITKLMTGLVAVESESDLTREVTVTDEWTGVEGSSIYLIPGEKITLEALLYGMLLRSGNDASLAVAGSCANSVDAFVAEMNRKAESLGMVDTSFANPNGLSDEKHYSSAYDMALLARACLQNETMAKIVSTKSIQFGTRTFTNHNKLLWRYSGCIGMKTGYTELAGRTLVSAAERDGLTLICVTLDAPDDWADHTALFDLGFAEYQSVPLVEEGEEVCRIPVTGSLTPFCSVTAKESAKVALKTTEAPVSKIDLTQPELSAPVVKGMPVGEIVYHLGEEELARVPLLAGENIPCNLAPKQDGFDWLNPWRKINRDK